MCSLVAIIFKETAQFIVYNEVHTKYTIQVTLYCTCSIPYADITIVVGGGVGSLGLL